MAKPPTETENLSLTVTLAGRPYPLRVLPDDEEPIRRIAKELNDKVASFQQTYPGKDKQDCLAMLLLIYAVDLYKVKDGTPVAHGPDPLLLDGLADLERQLARALAPPTHAPAPAAPEPPPAADDYASATTPAPARARGRAGETHDGRDRDGSRHGSGPGGSGLYGPDDDGDALGHGDDRIELIGPDRGPA